MIAKSMQAQRQARGDQEMAAKIAEYNAGLHNAQSQAHTERMKVQAAIDMRAQEYAQRTAERAEDRAWAEQRMEREHAQAMELQYGKQAFQLQKAGQAMRSQTGMRPTGVPSHLPQPMVGPYDQPRLNQWGKPIVPAGTQMGGGELKAILEGFPDPADRALVTQFYQRGEIDEIRKLRAENEGRYGVDNKIMQVERQLLQTERELRLAQKDEQEYGIDITSEKANLEAQRDRMTAEYKRLVAAKEFDVSPAKRAATKTIKEVPEHHQLQAMQAVMARLAGHDADDWEIQAHLFMELNMMGYDLSIAPRPEQPKTPAAEKPSDKQVPPPPDPTKTVAQPAKGTDAPAPDGLKRSAAEATMAERGMAGMMATHKQGVHPYAYTARHPLLAGAATYDEYGRPIVEGAEAMYHSAVAGMGHAVDATKKKIEEYPSLRYLFFGE
jgi:hypothetical protein